MPLVTLTDADQVADAAYDVKTQAYPDWSVDRFLCHPDAAIGLCKAVRTKLHRRRLSDFEILWTLVNAQAQPVAYSSGQWQVSSGQRRKDSRPRDKPAGERDVEPPAFFHWQLATSH